MGFHNPADFPTDKRKAPGSTELTNMKIYMKMESM